MANVWIDAIWRGQSVTAGVDRTKGELVGLGATASKVWAGIGGLSGALALGGIATGLDAVRKAIGAGVRGIEDWESAAQRTIGTLNNMGLSGEAAFGQVEAAVNRVVDATRFGDDQLLDAANQLIEGTQDVAGSLQNLSVVADLAAARQIDLASAAQIVAKVMEGNNRAVGQMLPFLRSYAESLESIPDPAERAAKMMERLTQAVGGKAAAELETGKGLWLDFTDALGEFFEAGVKAVGITDAWNDSLKKAADTLKGATSAVQSGGFFALNPMMMAGAGQGANMTAPQPTESPILGPGNAEGLSRFEAILAEWKRAADRWAFAADPKFPKGNTDRRGRVPELELSGANTRPSILDEDFIDPAKKRTREIADYMQQSISAAIVAGGTGGWDGFLSSLKQTGLQAFADLVGGALAGLFAPTSGGLGIIGKIFGLGGGSADNLARRGAR
jgi:hypothetical protein